MAAFASQAIERGNRRYANAVMQAPILEREHEFDLARRWREEKDESALHELIEAYARFVLRIAWKFRGYGLPVGDLVQEGNIGLMEAAQRFDPSHNARFSTYASWWCMAAIQDHILRNTSIVRVATTPAQRRLFFNLRKVRAQLATGPDGTLTDEDRERVAERLQVKTRDVVRMEAHLGGPDNSLNASYGDEDDFEFQDMLEDGGPNPEDITAWHHDGEVRTAWLEDALDTLGDRERQIIVRRFLQEKKNTLSEIGESFGVSKERIRQIEAKALGKLKHVLAEHGEDATALLSNDLQA
ncbi:MAG: RNA polymerase factor sigma-32 [Rhodospirillaceae bacterium]|jgi:RNA polymerase sigma-32 factor|nr:RNA polymerase factor sigma-32 [Rhodospirillaceae bacterium]MBT4772056.1 RNA polymerase factor sigma-32 [Rhodospirillaceae bacterium]MBT5357203.1 RNA polymerase factor sigma-32 [Rhodospirillaceae bacterium]MBT5770341.1 RNA polymerase factor sigma-32 [Rhodospirillaceae bacterium]MBT6311026.1 RNA polymerase factor sigma-32 [Rhodospirillaceae bacterium]